MGNAPSVPGLFSVYANRGTGLTTLRVRLYNFLAVETLSYATRARGRIWRDTRSSILRRVPPFVISLVGIAIGSIYGSLYLHRQIKETAAIALISGVGANVIWFLSVLIYNTVRVPWLLDAESGQQIRTLEGRALAAESALDDREKVKRGNKELHDKFGHLAQAGLEFLTDINRATTRGELMSWDRHFKTWVDDVQSAMRYIGCPTDAAEFMRAGSLAVPVQGVVNTPYEQETRRRGLKMHQDYLAEFVRRKLP
jgi:hypothetical protein